MILYKQLPRPKKEGINGFADGDKEIIHFFSDSQLTVEKLYRPFLEKITHEGIRFSGLEDDGFDKTGRQKFKYQEWWVKWE